MLSNVHIFWFCIICLLVKSFGQVPEGTPCYTSKQEYGICTKIKECGTFVNMLIQSGSNPQVKAYLRSSICSLTGSNPVVCCPQATPRNPLDGNTGDANSMADTDSGEVRTVRERALLSPPDCGFSNVTSYRVVGGVPAMLDEFPWIVALGYRNRNNPNVPKWLCGGTLITDRHILTAAHCVHNRRDLYLARLGELDLYDKNDGANPEDIPLIKANIHENYSPTSFTNDIAILTLERAPTNQKVWPICLPHAEPLRSNNFLKYSPIVAGWGALYFDGPSSSNLQLAEIPVVNIENCRRAFGNKTVIDDRIICAGWTDGKKDACQGDSGGPLMYGKSEGQNQRYYQIGIVSYGFRCAEANYPGVYTRVTNFVDWIKRNLA